MSHPTYRIGIHAPRNAGKTCLFACIYGLRPMLPDQVTLDHEPTLHYLRAIWEYLRKGQVPPATAMTRPTEMEWRLTSGEETWDIRSCDYPGALVEPSTDKTTRILRDEARAWFDSCDAILILVDSSAPDVEQLDVVDLLLAERRRDRAQKLGPRPLGLVLTKWDTQGPVSSDMQDESERLQEYFTRHPIFARLQHRLKEAGERFAVFPMSAFGTPGPGPGLAPPVAMMKPYNLLAPWKWAADQSRRLTQEQKRARRRRRLARLSMALFALVAMLAGTGAYAEWTAQREFAEIAGFRDSHSGGEHASVRVDKNERFLSAWWSRHSLQQRSIVRSWLESDKDQLEKHKLELTRLERVRRHDEGFKRILDEAPRLERTGSDAALHELYDQFLTDFPETPHAPALTPKRELARAAWDKRTWDELQEYFRVHGKASGAQALVSRVRAYLQIPQAANRNDALRLMADYEAQWDREEYGELLKWSGRGLDGQVIEQMHSRVVDYLNAPRNIKVMAAAVSAWRDWFQGLQVDREYTIRVKSVLIPRRSELDSFWGTDVRVALEMGEQTHRSDTYVGRAPTMNADLGPFRFRWGDPKRLIVRVENHFEILTNDFAEAVVEEERFLLGRCQGVVQVTCRKGKTISVTLECPGAIPPTLPAYASK